MITRVKICCIASVDEAWTAIQHGASAIGLVSEMPSGPGVISEERIAEIATSLPPAIGSFLLTSRQNVREIVTQQKRCGVNTVQLCDRLEAGTYGELREAMPGVSIVQVMHVDGHGTIDYAVSIAPKVDGILLDSGRPHLPVKELGGTGRSHDWALSRRIREAIQTPVFLAGGLTPQNVSEAITVVRPYAVDVCTGVRTDGRLDETKLAAFVKATQSV